MTEADKPASAEVVYKPCLRAFLVYYVAMFICLAGPRINPAVGVPVELGDLLGAILVLAVVYLKWGQEYLVTAQGVGRRSRWPTPRVQEISWANLGAVSVRRGLTQSLLRVGNLQLEDNSGGPALFWYGVPHPQEVKTAIEGRRP